MQLLIVLAVVLLIFGPSQLPKLAKSLGSSLKSFRDGLDESKGKIENDEEDEEIHVTTRSKSSSTDTKH